MSKIPVFDASIIEPLARHVAECGTGSEINSILNTIGIEDNSGESTKWRRLNSMFIETQKNYGCSNKIINFIQSFLAPVRFVGRMEEFEENRQELNRILAFSGLEFREDGKFRYCKKVETLNEAEKRVEAIRLRLQGRKIHPEVLKYCKKEIVKDDLFHAAFEATKGLSERIRQLSGIKDSDGVSLVEKVFSIKKPILAFNQLESPTEKSEHNGVASLLKGCFSAVRNPMAHTPKVLWKDEEDIADYFSLISLLHKKLDRCFQTRL